jgi:hypothetical protein
MKTGRSLIVALVITFELLLIGGRAGAQDLPTAARVLLKFCLDHPDACSITIDYDKGGHGYHIDYNGARLNSVASTAKVIDLLAYAVAVDENKIVPGQPVSRDEWARFWIGQDGGELAAAYKRFSNPAPPLTVTNDQIVSAMIQESDNAAPDYLLNKLGSDFIERTTERYVTGRGPAYLDPPESINAMFDSWTGGPPNPGSGIQALNDASGIESDEYLDTVNAIFTKMHDSDTVTAIRNYNGVLLPWATGTPPVAPGFPINESQYESLTKGFSTRSNTHTYNQLMLGLLRRDLLPAKAQTIVEGFLEYKLKAVPLNPDLANTVRYGVKDGSFAVYSNPVTHNGTTVRTRTIYVENKDGTTVVFTVQLTGSPGTPTDLGPTDGSAGSVDLGVRDFALAVANYPEFANEVQTKLNPVADAVAPSLIARIEKNQSERGDVKVKVKVTNIGTGATKGPLPLALFFSDDGKTQGAEKDRKEFRPLEPGDSAEVELNSRTLAATKFFMLVIDPENVIPAGQKQYNPQFEIVPGH